LSLDGRFSRSMAPVVSSHLMLPSPGGGGGAGEVWREGRCEQASSRDQSMAHLQGARADRRLAQDENEDDDEEDEEEQETRTNMRWRRWRQMQRWRRIRRRRTKRRR
jgi:hypothetical protein